MSIRKRRTNADFPTPDTPESKIPSAAPLPQTRASASARAALSAIRPNKRRVNVVSDGPSLAGSAISRFGGVKLDGLQGSAEVISIQYRSERRLACI